MTSTARLLAEATESAAPAGLLDEGAKREIRRAALTAVCVPGYQVPFGSREMPVARGWGSGGLQVTLAVIGAQDTVKVIDQGDDGGVNATNLRRMIAGTTGCAESADTRDATVVQTRHRVPEEALSAGDLLVYQVPVPEPLRRVQKSVDVCARMHAEGDYAAMWVSLYEDIVRNGMITRTTGYPVLVAGRYVMATTPIPRWDVPRLHRSEHVNLFGAGREKRIYAVPPHTDVVPLTFDDVPFEVEHTPGAVCKLCGSDDVFLVEAGAGGGYACSDTEWCARVRAGDADLTAHRLRSPLHLLPDPGRRAAATAGAHDRPIPRREVVVRPDAEWMLRVDSIGKVHGAGGVYAVEGTGPEHGTAVSPTTRGDRRRLGRVVRRRTRRGARRDRRIGLGQVDGAVVRHRRRARHRGVGTSGHGRRRADGSAGVARRATAAAAHRRNGRRPPESRRRARPRVSAGGNIAERLTAAGWRGYHDIRDRAAELLERVEVPLSRMDDPVGTFSGGMRQRVQIAKALATEPPVVLLDEPTTGLDASVAAGVIDLLRGLLSERNVAAVVVSHDFSVIESLTDRSIVMHLGRVIERGLTDQLFHDPHQPYTQRLVAAARR